MGASKGGAKRFEGAYRVKFDGSTTVCRIAEEDLSRTDPGVLLDANAGDTDAQNNGEDNEDSTGVATSLATDGDVDALNAADSLQRGTAAAVAHYIGKEKTVLESQHSGGSVTSVSSLR